MAVSSGKRKSTPTANSRSKLCPLRPWERSCVLTSQEILIKNVNTVGGKLICLHLRLQWGLKGKEQREEMSDLRGEGSAGTAGLRMNTALISRQRAGKAQALGRELLCSSESTDTWEEHRRLCAGEWHWELGNASLSEFWLGYCFVKRRDIFLKQLWLAVLFL